MIVIRELQERDVSRIAEAFKEIGWDKPVSQYERYLSEQNSGVRKVLVAIQDEVFAGYLTIIRESVYPPFKAERIPEIADFNVLPRFRRKGIGSKLMDKAEEHVSQSSKIVGIGVGLDADYGAAQRLYVLRGYVPDGKGIVWQNRFPKHNEQVSVDDGLSLYFTKALS